MTAALIVGEKLTIITTRSATIVSFGSPAASGAIGSHGHTIQMSAARPASATASVINVVVTAPGTRRSSARRGSSVKRKASPR